MLQRGVLQQVHCCPTTHEGHGFETLAGRQERPVTTDVCLHIHAAPALPPAWRAWGCRHRQAAQMDAHSRGSCWRDRAPGQAHLQLCQAAQEAAAPAQQKAS